METYNTMKKAMIPKFDSFEAVQVRAEELLKIHLLSKKGWVFEYDGAVRRFGRCSHRNKCISLSLKLTQLNWKKNPQQVLDVILHEIAHALNRCENGGYDRYG
jgi:Zn-dependent protease with chaperone function